MRVLDLAEFYSERGGGVRSYLGKFVRTAGKLGHEVVVVAPGPRDEERTFDGNSGRLIRYAAPPMPYDPTYHMPIRIGRMRQLVRALHPDVLQVSTPFVPALVAATLGDVGLKAYVHHADPIGCYLRPLARRWLPGWMSSAVESPAWSYLARLTGRFDITVASGQWLADELKQRGCQRVTAVDFGIDKQDFGPNHKDADLRLKLLGPLANDPGARLLLIAGRMAIDKRQARLVEAVVQVASRRPIGLVLLGDGPERQHLVRLASRLKAFRHFAFTDSRAQYASILASVDGLVHGSPCETFGFVLAEALASGTPLVVPDAGGAAQLADPRCAERYPPCADSRAVAQAIERLLERPERETRDAALMVAQSLPSTEEHFEALFGLYETMLKERPQ